MTFFPRPSSIFPTILLLLGSAFAAAAQSDRPELTRRGENDRAEDKTVLGSIRGRIVLPDGNYIKSNVRITLQTFRAAVTTIYTDNQGQFEFPDLIPGTYQLEIDPTDREHFEPSNESVQVFKGLPSILSLTLKPRETDTTRSTAPFPWLSLTPTSRPLPARNSGKPPLRHKKVWVRKPSRT